jgi:hypothetical protein
MSPSPVQSYEELFDYLVLLSRVLNAEGEAELAREVSFASEFASGSFPTEFMGEARIALRKVRATCARALTREQLADLDSTIEWIDAGFREVGGG